MARLWLLFVGVAAVTLIIVPSAEGKRPLKLEEYTPFEIAALGDIPTCCPETPLRYCDFYFDAHYHTVPTFHINDGRDGDHPVSPADPKKLNWKGWMGHFSPSLRDSKTGNLVYVGSTWKNGTFLQCKRLPPWLNTAGQFFISSVGDGATDADGSKLHVRTFQRATAHQHGMKFFFNRCIMLPLTQITIPSDNGNVNLEADDGNPDYPEKRRCVIFRTTR